MTDEPSGDGVPDGPDGPDGVPDGPDRGRVGKAARLTDIRRIIGGLFCLYGVMLTITGAVDSAAEINKAEGVRINLWTGLAMLVVGVSFLTWALLRPVPAPE